jgi:hypothetical protein
VRASGGPTTGGGGRNVESHPIGEMWLKGLGVATDSRFRLNYQI